MVNCVKPTPKLMSSTSWSTMRSSEVDGKGGFSSNLRRASQVKAQPFLYFSAKAVDEVMVFVREITAVLRSRGRMSFWVLGRTMLR